MNLLDRIASRIAAQSNCVKPFPCPLCDYARTDFEGGGCRTLAISALAAFMPDVTANPDDEARAVSVALETDLMDAVIVSLVVEAWVQKALTE